MGLGEFLWSIAVKKGVKETLKVLAALLAVKAGVLSQFGISVDLNTFQVAGTSVAIGGLELARNWLKQKFGLKWL